MTGWLGVSVRRKERRQRPRPVLQALVVQNVERTTQMFPPCSNLRPHPLRPGLQCWCAFRDEAVHAHGLAVAAVVYRWLAVVLRVRVCIT